MARRADALGQAGARLLAGMAAAVALVAASAAAPAAEPLTIVVVAAPAEPGTLWAAARQGAEAAARSLDVTLHFAAPEGRGGAAVAAAIDAALAGRPAGIVASIPDADLLAPALGRAAEAAVPLITIGEGFDVARALGAVLHVGQDDHEAGRTAGEAMRQLGARNAVCLAGSPLGLAQDLRCKGLTEAFDQPVALLPVGGGADAVEAALTAALEADSSIDAVISVAGGPAGAAAVAAIQALGRAERVRVAAFDPGPGFIAALADGQAAFAVDQQPWLQGYLAVALLAQHHGSGLMPVGNIRTGPRILTPDAARALRAAAPAD